MICFGAQVDHRRVLAELKLGQPVCAVVQPLDLVAEPLCDQLAPGELVIVTAVGVFRCRPAVQRAQLTQRRIETVDVRDSRRHARRHSSLPIDTRATNERIALCPDDVFAKANGLACWSPP